jgi:hypothetical protein
MDKPQRKAMYPNVQHLPAPDSYLPLQGQASATVKNKNTSY